MDVSRTEPGADLERLRTELTEVKDQLFATSDVLTAIGRSASDVDAVLGTVVDSARQLCHADVAQIHLVEDGVLKLARSSGLSEAGVEFMARHPMGPDRQSLIGRVQLYGKAQQITDVLADPDYPRLRPPAPGRPTAPSWACRCCSTTRSSASCSCGVSRSTRSTSGRPQLLTTFAAQAAHRHPQRRPRARPREPPARSSASKVEQLEALGEIGQAVSSSLDLDEVLTTIVTHAVAAVGHRRRLADGVRRRSQLFHVRTAYGTSPELLEALRHTRIDVRRHVGRPGRAAEGRRCRSPDLRRRRLDPTCGCCTTPAGGRCSPCRCCARAGSSAPWSCGARRRATSPRRPASCCRPSPASPPWPSSTRGCSASSSSRPPSSRWPASTSRSSWPACRTSCGPRSTR